MILTARSTGYVSGDSRNYRKVTTISTWEKRRRRDEDIRVPRLPVEFIGVFTRARWILPRRFRHKKDKFLVHYSLTFTYLPSSYGNHTRAPSERIPPPLTNTPPSPFFLHLRCGAVNTFFPSPDLDSKNTKKRNSFDELLPPPHISEL